MTNNYVIVNGDGSAKIFKATDNVGVLTYDRNVDTSASLIASEVHIGEVGSRLIRVSTSFTNTSGSGTAYSIGDTVSSGSSVTTPFELTNAFRVDGGSGYVVGLYIYADQQNITPAFRVHFYSASNVTLSGDNSPYLENYSDIGYSLGCYDMPIMLSGEDYFSIDDSDIRVPVLSTNNSKSLFFALEILWLLSPNLISQNYTITVDILNN
jgi:hypothetical protein